MDAKKTKPWFMLPIQQESPLTYIKYLPNLVNCWRLNDPIIIYFFFEKNQKKL